MRAGIVASSGMESPLVGTYCTYLYSSTTGDTIDTDVAISAEPGRYTVILAVAYRGGMSEVKINSLDAESLYSVEGATNYGVQFYRQENVYIDGALPIRLVGNRSVVGIWLLRGGEGVVVATTSDTTNGSFKSITLPSLRSGDFVIVARSARQDPASVTFSPPTRRYQLRPYINTSGAGADATVTTDGNYSISSLASGTESSVLAGIAFR